MFHEDSHNHIDKDKLGHQYEDYKEDGGDESANTAICQTLLWGVAVITQGVLQSQEISSVMRHEEVQTIMLSYKDNSTVHSYKSLVFLDLIPLTFMIPFQLSPVATLNSVRNAIPKSLKWACSPKPSQGWASEHSEISHNFFVQILSYLNLVVTCRNQ